jgi:hypothetical protein
MASSDVMAITKWSIQAPSSKKSPPPGGRGWGYYSDIDWETRHPRFPHDLARIIHDADARFLDRHIESSKIGHAALLLLMLEAADADLVSPSA